MRSHIAVDAASVSAALAFITEALIVAVFTVAQPYAAEWRSASAPLPLVQLPTELTARNAAATIPTGLATKNLSEIRPRRMQIGSSLV